MPPTSRTSLLAVLVAAGAATGQDSLAWTRVAPATTVPETTAPANSVAFGLTYDLALARTVLFSNGRTWTWDGTDWSETVTAHAPTATSGFCLGYDPTRTRVVLFGGITGGQALGETWEWDGSDWTQVVTTHSPSPRTDAAIAFDAISNRILLFGGFDPTTTSLDDTWSYDGSNWVQLAPTTTPPARTFHAMTSSLGAGLVMFGGTVDPQSGPNDTWIWDGADWNGIPATALGTQPFDRWFPQMCFDTAQNRVLLYGGATPVLVGGGFTAFEEYNDLWQFDGSTWSQLAPRGALVRNAGRRMAWDLGRDRAVLFGGGFLAEPDVTWELRPLAVGEAHVHTFGHSCTTATDPGPSLESIPSGDPELGGVLTLVVRNVPTSPGLTYLFLGSSRTVWNGVALPQPLAPLFGLIQFCEAFISLDAGVFLPTATTRATWSAPMPSDATLLGFEFYAQAFAFEPASGGASFAPGRMSNALGVVLGN